MRSFYTCARLALTFPLLLAGCGGGDPVDETGRDVAEWVVLQGGTVVTTASDRTLSRVGQLPEGELGIKEIDLTAVPVRNRDLERFEPLENLRALTLYQTKVTDAGMDAIVAIDGLERLDLSYTTIGDAALEKLVELDSLKKLYVRGTAVTEDGITSLKNARSGIEVVAR